MATLLPLGWSFFSDSNARKSVGWGKAIAGFLAALILVGLARGILRSLPSDPWHIPRTTILFVCLFLATLYAVSNQLSKLNGIPTRNLMYRLSLALFFGLTLLAIAISQFVSLTEQWHKFSPYDSSGTALLAFIFGLVSWYPLNELLFPYPAAIDRLYRHDHISALESLLYESMLDTSQIQITVDDGKVYVGWPVHIAARLSGSDSFVKILPLSSGYREEATKKVTFTTFYEDVYERLAATASTDEPSYSPDDFVKVIPISRIVVAGKFHPEAYKVFNNIHTANSDREPSIATDAESIDQTG